MAAGLSLRTGVSGNVTGNYSPMTPAAAQSSTANSTISQKAYGINGTGAGNGGSPVAGFGSMGVGGLALAALIYLWWSLPR